MSLIIGVSGKKGAGKDTVATIIQSLYPCTFGRIGFATALKQEVAMATGRSVEFIERNKQNFRLILQGWGTDYRRKLCGENYWVNVMEKAIQHMSRCDIILIPDVRFQNEYDFVKRACGMLIRVNRTGLVSDTHKSETELDNNTFDFTITNDDTLESLVEQVKQIKITI